MATTRWPNSAHDPRVASAAPGDQARIEGNGQVQAADGQQQQDEAGRAASSGSNRDRRRKRGGGKDPAEEHHASVAGTLARRFGGNPQFEGGRHDFLKELLEFVYRQNQQSERERSGLSIEIALAQGFKYAANRRREHPQAHSEARAYLADQAKEMLSACSFWYHQAYANPSADPLAAAGRRGPAGSAEG